MSKTSNIYILSAIILMTIITTVNAQNTNQYVYPFESKKLSIESQVNDNEYQQIFSNLFPKDDYTGLEFIEIFQRKSLGGTHTTFQAQINNIPIEQAMIKIHSDHSGMVRLIQSNLPELNEWKSLNFAKGITNDKFVYVYIEDKFVLVEKEQYTVEKRDIYSNQFWYEGEILFENELKYHSDTTAYAKVFKPDPLSSSSMIYGGNYQDAFRFDTAALVIQNLNNPGTSSITANGTTYSYGGQAFNVPTESYVNNFTAPIIRQVFQNIFLNGQGVVVGFNTEITDDVASYTTEIIIEDFNYPELAQEQLWGEMPVDYSNGEFNLSNDFFIISDLSPPFTNASTSPSDSFDFNRSELDFEDVNAFYHLNNYKSYWESLGFTDLASEVIMVDAHGNNGADNSFFSPTSPPRLVFGQGGVDDAEDADVIIHEYGHAISAFASPETNVSDERRALDEGFGDYLATSYSKQFTSFSANDVFTWDGHNEFWIGRISNSNKTKLDLSSNQNIYFNGEIWSTTLNDLYNELGATVCDKLAIEVMYYNMPNTSISAAAENLFVADTMLFGGIHSCEIFDVLFARKFLLGTCLDFYSGIRNKPNKEDNVQLLNSYGYTHYNQAMVLQFKNDSYLKSEVQLYDVNGTQILNIYPDSESFEIILPELSSGIYYMQLRTKNNSYRYKLLKK